MARTGISSYISKPSTYPTSTYTSSYHVGNYTSKPQYTSSYSKLTLDYRRPFATTPLRARDSSTSGYQRSSSNYASSFQPARSTLTTPALEPKRYGLSSIDRERTSRRDTFGTKASLPPRPTNYSSGYSSSYRSSRDNDRTYGRFSQERTTDVSRDLGELNLGSRFTPLRRSSSHFDLASSRISVERSSVGRDTDEKDTAVCRVTPRIHPTMGGYGMEKRLGGSSEVETEEDGKGEANDRTDSQSFYGNPRSGRRSPSTDRRYINTEAEVSRTKRYGSVDRFSSARASVRSASGDDFP